MFSCSLTWSPAWCSRECVGDPPGFNSPSGRPPQSMLSIFWCAIVWFQIIGDPSGIRKHCWQYNFILQGINTNAKILASGQVTTLITIWGFYYLVKGFNLSLWRVIWCEETKSWVVLLGQVNVNRGSLFVMNGWSFCFCRWGQRIFVVICCKMKILYRGQLKDWMPRLQDHEFMWNDDRLVYEWAIKYCYYQNQFLLSSYMKQTCLRVSDQIFWLND